MIAKKVCRKCGKRKALALFDNDRNQADGRAHNCKRCRFLVTKAWRLKAYGKPMQEKSAYTGRKVR